MTVPFIKHHKPLRMVAGKGTRGENKAIAREMRELFNAQAEIRNIPGTPFI